MLKLNRFIQKKSNDCGPASIFIILKFFGIKTNYKEVLEVTKCKKNDGVDGPTAAKTLTHFGLDGKYVDFCSIEGLRYCYERDIPVMVAWFTPRLTQPGNHWSVIQSVTKKTVRLMDPAIGKTRSFPIDDFEALWFTINAGASKRSLTKSPLNQVGIREAVIPKSCDHAIFMSKTAPSQKELRKVAEQKKGPNLGPKK